MRVDPSLLADRYQILQQIGSGGMGAIWLAKDLDLERTVAVKELRLPEGVTDEACQIFYARLEREARAAARLKHPGIITVHDRVRGVDGRPFIVMEYVQGGSLQDLLTEHGRLPVTSVAAIGTRMLDALRLCHEHGIVHRDVKPANVLLEGERVVLTDFGIASLEGDVALTRSGAVLGTPAFMAPEQVRGLPATAETDLWSLGATLYAAVEGTNPFGGMNAGAVFVGIVTEEPGPCVHAGPLAPVLMGLMDKDPARRLTAESAHAQLTALAHGAEPILAPTVPPTPPALPPAAPYTPDAAGWPAHRPVSQPPARFPGYVLGAAAVAAAVLIVGVIWALVHERDPDRGRNTVIGQSPPSTASTHTSTPEAASSPPEPEPTVQPEPDPTGLDRSAINRVFKTYMDGLAEQNMTLLRSGTCPRFRSGLLGFVLEPRVGAPHYVADWKLLPYTIPEGRNELSVEAEITKRDLDSGKITGKVKYQWIIERDEKGDYWTCGWLNGR